jgi:hypothetical protein
MWQERCAAARCTPDAQYDLSGFAFDRFRHYLQKVRPSLAPPAAPDAWHAFESHLALGKTRPLKAWKQWLFARGGTKTSVDCIQGGATLIMRDVVRAHLRTEHAPEWMMSLDVPVDPAADDKSSTIKDLLPDSDRQLATLYARECDALTAALLEPALGLLSWRQQLAMTVNHAGRALSHPTILQAAACGKSTLCDDLHRGMQTLAQWLRDALSTESTSIHIEVAKVLIEKISRKMQKYLEIEHPDLFRYLEGTNDC